MSDEAHLDDFYLHFEGDRVRDHTIPAGALIQAIQSLQRAVHLVALHYEGREVDQRLRLSFEMENKYAVVFGTPREGSYELPYQIGPSQAARLFDPQDSKAVSGLFCDVLGAIEESDAARLRRILPTATVRRAVLGELKKMQPHKRSNIYVSIEGQGKKWLDGRKTVAAIDALVAEPTRPTTSLRLVTGRLDSLDFQQRSLRLQLPTGRSLVGRYGEDFELVLVENRRQWLQVRGEAVLDERDRLKSLENITEIIEVDTAPIDIFEFALDGNMQVFNAKEPVTLSVSFDPESELYTAEGPFHLMVSGPTRDELEAEAKAMLALLWREYVDIEESCLSGDALELRRALINAFGARPHAS